MPSKDPALYHNCNSALGWFGSCPHANAEKSAETAAMLTVRQAQGHRTTTAFSDISKREVSRIHSPEEAGKYER